MAQKKEAGIKEQFKRKSSGLGRSTRLGKTVNSANMPSNPKSSNINGSSLSLPKAKLKKISSSEMALIKADIEKKIHGSVYEKPAGKFVPQKKDVHVTKGEKQYIKTGIPGFDGLLDDGIPKGSAVIVAGGAGSGKTIFCLQTLFSHALHGEKCLYMSFEESESSLIQHMRDFGWDIEPFLKKKIVVIKRFNPFDITRNVDALLMKAKGELLIDVEPVILPDAFKPDLIVIDSLTAVDSAFSGKEDSYRIYIEQLFRFFERLNTTAFLITETEQVPKMFSTSGVEEFLADGVIVMYAIKKGNVRENAIEVLKMRGARHQKKIVAMAISDNGIEVFPEQEVFGGIE